VTESSAPTATGPLGTDHTGEGQEAPQAADGAESVPAPRPGDRPAARGDESEEPTAARHPDRGSPGHDRAGPDPDTPPDRGPAPEGDAAGGDAAPAAAQGHPSLGRGLPWARLLRGAAVLVALAVVLLTAVEIMRPALDAPTNGDERYTYLDSPVRSAGSVGDSALRAWDTFFNFLDTARPRIFGYGTMFTTYTTIANYSVEHKVPIWLLQSRFKIILLAGGIIAVLAFVRALRGRLPDGRVVAPSARTVLLVGAVVAAAVAAGCQTQDQYRNAWTAYPLLTYSSVFVVLGVAAFTLLAARLLAEHGVRVLPPVVLILLPLGIWLNLTFEMYYIAFPVALLALFLQPITRRGKWSPARVRIVLVGAFGLVFVPLFIWIRLYINHACEENSCYVGAMLHLGEGVVTSSWLNLVSSGPFDRDEHVRQYLDSIGWNAAIPDGVPGSVLVTSVLLAVALLAVRVVGGPPGSDTVPAVCRRRFVRLPLVRRRPVTDLSGAGAAEADEGVPTGDGPSSQDGEDVAVTLDHVHRAQAAALLRGAAVAAVAAVGSSVVMALSVQAQELIRSTGDLYRNTVFTWVALCTVAALLLVAGDLWLRSASLRAPDARARRACLGSSMVLWTSAGVLLAFTVTQTYPTNEVMTRAVREFPMAKYPDLIYDEVMHGDLSDTGRERRCELLGNMREDGLWFGERMRLGSFADGGFRLYHGEPFCLRPVEWREGSQIWAVRMEAQELKEQARRQAWQEGRPNDAEGTASQGTGASGGAGD
jgi:hypothetical protein